MLILFNYVVFCHDRIRSYVSAGSAEVDSRYAAAVHVSQRLPLKSCNLIIFNSIFLNYQFFLVIQISLRVFHVIQFSHSVDPKHKYICDNKCAVCVRV